MKVMDKGWKMKKRLVAFLLCCAAASSFATFQFDYGSISAAHSDYGKDTYDAYADRAGRFGLQNAFYFNTGSYLYASFSKGAPEFGAYYLDGRNKGEEIRLADIGNGQYTAIGADGKALKFNAGDSIGFWTRDADGRTVYNTPGLDGQHTYNGTAILDRNNYVVAFGKYGQYVSSPTGNYTYDQMIDAAQSVLNVQVGSKAPVPSGQPLPGLLAALLVCGGTYTGYRLRNRKTRA